MTLYIGQNSRNVQYRASLWAKHGLELQYSIDNGSPIVISPQRQIVKTGKMEERYIATLRTICLFFLEG